MLYKCTECGTEVSEKAFACPKCGASDPTGKGAKFVKNFFIGIIVIIFSLALLMTISTAEELDSNKAELAKAAIKAEPKVVDITYEPSAAVQWHIGVYDDGSKRYGYASYICDILHEHSLVSAETSVRIVDIKKVNNGQTFRQASLGRVNCSAYQQYDP